MKWFSPLLLRPTLTHAAFDKGYLKSPDSQSLTATHGTKQMKYPRLILAMACASAISCKASDASLKKDEVRCPPSVVKGQNVPSGSILIGTLPGSKKMLLSAGLITKSGSKLQDQVWDEETVYFEESPEGMVAEPSLDTSLNDPYLKCSYPGAVDPIRKEYFDVQLLIPIRPHVAGSCKFKRSGSEMSAACEYKP